MTHRRRRQVERARNIEAHRSSKKAHLAVRARYHGGEFTVEARERTAILAAVVLVVVVSIAVMVVVVT